MKITTLEGYLTVSPAPLDTHNHDVTSSKKDKGAYQDNAHAPPGIEFIDVTLVLKDEQPPAAHNVILSAT